MVSKQVHIIQPAEISRSRSDLSWRLIIARLALLAQARLLKLDHVTSA